MFYFNCVVLFEPSGENAEKLLQFKRWFWSIVEKMSMTERQDLVGRFCISLININSCKCVADGNALVRDARRYISGRPARLCRLVKKVSSPCPPSPSARQTTSTCPPPTPASLAFMCHFTLPNRFSNRNFY